jgi:hypothetical protein
MTPIARGWRAFVTLLRALGDEDAYARYREQHGLANSSSTWRRFCEERSRHRCDRMKCC